MNKRTARKASGRKFRSTVMPIFINLKKEGNSRKQVIHICKISATTKSIYKIMKKIVREVYVNAK
jgi:hypothetical protein